MLAAIALFGAAAPATAMAQSAQAQQLALAASGAVKLVVRSPGWLRVTQPALVAAGLPATVDPSKLQLFADGVEHALTVTGNGDATFTADEAIEFYGEGRDTLWTDARTYWLVSGVAGARVPVAPTPAGGAAPASFVHDEPLIEHKNYVSSILNGDESNFYGDAVAATPVGKTLPAHHLDAAAAATAVLSVRLQGVTTVTHQVDVSLGGQLLGTATFGPRVEATFSFAAPGVVEGDNQVTLVSHGATDLSVIASLVLSYPHTYAADADALAFTAPAATRVSIAGFSAPTVRVVDVTDAAHPIELVVTPTGAAGSSTARVDTPGTSGTRALVAFLAANVAAPASVAADAPSSWSSPHDGELVILSHASFLGALAPLVAQRAAQGWTVQLVDVQDVYDERGGGDKTPFAIRDFLQAARASWRVPPRFVLLVGDATFDPRNFLGQGDFDFMPTKLIDTATMETASDDWFADADLDGVPDLAVGRIPARTPADATAVVAKTLAYAGKADFPRGGLFVTDENDPSDPTLDFAGASALSETEVAALMPVDRFSRDMPDATSDALLAKLDAGPFLVNYFGHGSVEVWDGLLSSAQAPTLTNDQGSIYVVMNCLNGFFHDLYTTSLAEALLEAPHGGAVAVWASSTLAEFDPQPAYNRAFLAQLGRTSLGETAMQAKQSISDADSRRTWILFGDPTLLGAPQTLPNDGGLVDGGNDDGGLVDGGNHEGGGALDAGAADADGGTASADATPIDASANDAGAPDVSLDGAPADATALDAPGGGTDAAPTDAAQDRLPAPAADAGCGCAIDVAATRQSSGLALLLLACVAATRRRARRARGARRGWLGLLTLAITWLAFAPSAHAAYGYRMALTIDRTRIGSATGATTLTSYPLLIDLTSANLENGGAGHVTSASGYDIAFKGADTATCGGPSTCTFNYEIESYDGAAGHVIAWVQIPSLKTAAGTTNTVIYVNYGDPAVVAPTQNVNGTWDTSFKGVWHMNQSPVTTQTDSTSSAASSTATGTPTPTTATGLVSGGVNLSSATGASYFDYRSTAFNWTSSDSFTYSGWFKTTDGTGPLISQRDTVGKPVIDITLGYDGVTRATNDLVVLVRDDTGSTYAEVADSTAVNDGAWHLFTVTRTGGTIQLYLDGTSKGSGTNAGASGSITTGASGSYQHLGKEGNWVAAGYGSGDDDRYLAGTFDEYRISKTIRSSDWIATDYQTQSAPASTFSTGPEALASCGDGTTGTGETCDDGNIVSGDGCSGTCTIETGYHCSGTPSVCATTCGDGVVGGSEVCDDGNVTNGDGCSSTCAVENLYHCTAASPSVCTFAQFNYYKTITINQALVGTATAPATLTNYPVLISVTDSSLRTVANGGRVQNANGYDLAFQGSDTTTCGGPRTCGLSHEVERYDPTTGQLIAWVQVPGLNTQTAAASTQIHIVFGNLAISTSTERKTAVWDSTFNAVWHLEQDPTGTAPQMTDSTANGNNGTSASLATASARVGSGVTTNGSTSYMSFNAGTSLNTPAAGAFTYSTWLNTTDPFGGIISLRRALNDNSDVDIMVGMDGANTNSGNLLALVRDDTGGLGDILGGPINDGVWHLVTVTRSGSTITLYVDAASKGTASDSGAAIGTDIRNLGREGYWSDITPTYTSVSNEYLAATFDEVRASSTARTLDWVTTDYNAQSSPATFITYTTGPSGEVSTDIHTAVSLVSFDAAATCADTTVSWQTAYEVDTLGFNVYRDLGGARTKLNAALVPGAGVTGGGSHRYAWVDGGPLDPGRTYALETVHFDLSSTWDGPATVRSTCASATPLTSTSVASGATPAAPSPVAVAGETAGPGTDPELGGCSLAPGRHRGLVPLTLALALVALKRRKRS